MGEGPTADNLGVQPASPVVLYTRSELDLNGLSAHFCAELAALQPLASIVAD